MDNQTVQNKDTIQNYVIILENTITEQRYLTIKDSVRFYFSKNTTKINTFIREHNFGPTEYFTINTLLKEKHQNLLIQDAIELAFKNKIRNVFIFDLESKQNKLFDFNRLKISNKHGLLIVHVFDPKVLIRKSFFE